MNASIFYFILISLVFFSTSVFPANLQVSSHSYLNLNLSSCYRWMSEKEAKKWLKGDPKFGLIPFYDQLQRGRENPHGIYCWTHPAGSVAGNLGKWPFEEVYGKYLVRIDFKKDVVIFDRVTNKYYQKGQELTRPHLSKKEMDTEISYANYTQDGSEFMQEIIIKDIRAIHSYTFNDHDLRAFFEKDYENFFSASLKKEDIHFLKNYCPLKITKFCARYIEILNERKKHLHHLWGNNLIPNYNFIIQNE
ncbi:MAG: hypothetical protein AB7I27_03500 [Bacteriovoracaceae bacterium]